MPNFRHSLEMLLAPSTVLSCPLPLDHPTIRFHIACQGGDLIVVVVLLVSFPWIEIWLISYIIEKYVGICRNHLGPREPVRGPRSPSQLLHFVDKSLKEDRASGEQVLKIPRIRGIRLHRMMRWTSHGRNKQMAYMLGFIWVVYGLHIYIFSRKSMK